MSELIAMCVQYEERLKIEKPDTAYLTTNKGQKKKKFKAKVENQLNRKIKIVRSDTGGEYYGKHSDLDQIPGSFALYCQENGIVNLFTMPYTSQQNGVAERRNRTLIDMMRIDAPPHDETQFHLLFSNYYEGKVKDPIFYNEAINSNQSTQWLEAMNDELKSMQINDVWELAELPNGVKPIGCKWVYKMKLDQKGNIKRYKARLVAKGYTQKERIEPTGLAQLATKSILGYVSSLPT
ncbi:retrovirus-related pol polyprotein from transposon TNT 1-94 [Tanacetum coccineum]